MDAKSTSGVPNSAASTHEREQRLRLLVHTGLALAVERDPGHLAQTAIDAAVSISRARFGMFFFNTAETDGAPSQDVKLATDDPELLISTHAAKTHFALAQDSAFHSGDINAQPQFATHQFFEGTPFATQIPRSLLSVPVRNSAGALLGGIVLAHPNIDKFGQAEEDDVVTLAAQAAAALENAHMSTSLAQEIGYADSARKETLDATRRLSQALDAAQLGTWTWDRKTDLMDLDERAAELLDGGKPHTPISRTELRKRIVHSEDMNATANDMNDALSRDGSYNAEYRIENRDGRVRWVSSRGVATYNVDEGTTGVVREVTGMIGTIQDVTSRKTQEATLRQSEKLAATGRLAATIAHEINNPLEAVTNLIYLCKTDPTIPPPLQYLLDTADNELERVSQIAQQTLGFYRDTTRPVDIDLSALLESVVNLFSRKMDYKKIRCDLDVSRGLHIFGLQGEVRQVFSNLLVNAIDASNSSTIRVRARSVVQNSKRGVSVLISDQGSGIPDAVRQKLFSPFFTTKESLGTGLGLWVTRGIIEKQGGTIRFRSCSTRPTGTVFRVFLPAEFLNPENFPTTKPKRIQ